MNNNKIKEQSNTIYITFMFTQFIFSIYRVCPLDLQIKLILLQETVFLARNLLCFSPETLDVVGCNKCKHKIKNQRTYLD